MKKLFSILLSLVLAAGCLAGCAETAEEPDPSDIRERAVTSSLVEVELPGYELSNVMNTGAFESAGLCSAVQTGPYRGHNCDWYYDDNVVYVLHTTAGVGHYASVGVTSDHVLDEENTAEPYEQMYFRTIDGINETGLIVSTNVMDPGVSVPDGDTSNDLPAGIVCRVLLDRCATVDECMELLSYYDVTSSGPYWYHWMVTDSAGCTAIAEMDYDDESGCNRVTWMTYDTAGDEHAVMTNFAVHDYDGETEEGIECGCGFERYRILDRYYSQADSVRAAYYLMRKVFFSNTYDYYTGDFWYSEFNGERLQDYIPDEYVREVLGSKVYNECTVDGVTCYQSKLMRGDDAPGGDANRMGIFGMLADYMDDLKPLWITGFTSIYNEEDLSLNVSIHEGIDLYTFGIAME